MSKYYVFCLFNEFPEHRVNRFILWPSEVRFNSCTAFHKSSHFQTKRFDGCAIGSTERAVKSAALLSNIITKVNTNVVQVVREQESCGYLELKILADVDLFDENTYRLTVYNCANGQDVYAQKSGYVIKYKCRRENATKQFKYLHAKLFKERRWMTSSIT